VLSAIIGLTLRSITAQLLLRGDASRSARPCAVTEVGLLPGPPHASRRFGAGQMACTKPPQHEAELSAFRGRELQKRNVRHNLGVESRARINRRDSLNS